MIGMLKEPRRWNRIFAGWSLVACLLVLTSCQQGSRWEGAAPGEVVPIEDPCEITPETVYPPEYPLTLLIAEAGVVIDPLIPILPEGPVCLPGLYSIDPPLQEGLALNPANGRIYGAPLYADSSTLHTITTQFPIESASSSLQIIVPPAAPSFEYPNAYIELEPLEQFWMLPLQLPGSGAVEVWSSPTDDAPVGAFQLNAQNGTLTLHGVGDYWITVVGLNSSGEDTFTIQVETVSP